MELRHHLEQAAEKAAWKEVAQDRARAWDVYRQEQARDDVQPETPARPRRWGDVQPEAPEAGEAHSWRSRRSAEERRQQGVYRERDHDQGYER